MQTNVFMPVVIALVAAVLVTGCAKSSDSADASASPSATVAGMAMSSTSEHAVAAAGDPAKGATVFATNCAVCHGAKGVGGGVGPALIGENKRKDVSATVAWIKNPQPPMPKLYPSPLSQTDVADVAAYVASL